MSAYRWIVMAVFTMGMLLLGMGCEGPDPDPPIPPDCDSLVMVANNLLEQTLYQEINSEPQSPQDIDFTAANTAYQTALSSCPDHGGANFGAGMLEVVMLTRDTQVQNFFDRMSAFMDSGRYFEVTGAAVMGGTVHAAGPVLTAGGFALPVFAPVQLARRMSHLDENDPQPSELQNLCMTLVLPRLEQARSRLAAVAQDAAFTFIVTPHMQGDDGEDAVEIDQTEIRLTLAALSALEAVLHQFCAYNLNLPAYDGAGMIAAISQGSTFATLTTTGAGYMQSARQEWLDVLNYGESALDFLDSETDYQGDDAIHYDATDPDTRDAVDSIRHYLPMVRQALTTSQVFSVDTDEDEMTPPEEITISLAAFFNNPIADWKALFPTYTVALDTQIVANAHFYDYEGIPATVTLAEAGTVYVSRYAYYHYGVLDYEYDYSAPDVPAWDQAFEAKALELADKPEAWISMFHSSGFLAAGTHELTGNLSWNYAVPTQQRYTPRITWAATSFTEWQEQLPDPTIGGLFPGMTRERFVEITGMRAEDWQQVSSWYLW